MLLMPLKISISFLATAHEVSHDIAPIFLARSGGVWCSIYPAPTEYKNKHFYQQYYGFEHKNTDWLSQAVYGLAEWNADQISQGSTHCCAGLLSHRFSAVVKAIS